tara:strand:+ start:3656 stop:5479 length:1824 start_codon:yes stop_codon:yes gene_type:complete
MAFNPMQQQQSPDMLMAMMTDPRTTPQQRMAAMSALNAMKGGANAPQPPQMTGDSTGVSQIDPGFMAAVRQEMLGQGPEEQPEIPQRQAAPEAPQNPSTEALMSGAADADKVAAMARGGAVRGYAAGGDVSSNQGYLPESPTELLRIATTSYDPVTRLRAKQALDAMRGQGSPQEVAPTEQPYSPGLPSFRESSLGRLLYGAKEKKLQEPVQNQNLENSEIGRLIFSEDPSERLLGMQQLNQQKSADAPTAAPTAAPTVDPRQAAPRQDTPRQGVPRQGAPVTTVGAGKLMSSPDITNKLTIAPQNLAQEVSKKKDYFKLLEEKLTEDKSKLSSQDKYMGLLQAGLGTMAAASQPGASFLGSIGQGGMLGIKQIEDARVLRAKERAGDLDTYAKLAEIQQKSKEKILSKGQEAIDTNYGKEYADFLSRGGASVAAGQLKNLADARNIITDAIANKKPITGAVASFVTSDNMPKWLGGFAAPETVTVQDMINSVAQSNLRATLGAQFAQKEGEGVLQRVFNPAVSPQENLRRLDMLTSSIDSASKAKEAEAKYFKENDTLAGYEGPSVNDYLYELRDNLDKSDKNNSRKSKNPISENRSAADKILSGE